MTLSAPSGNPQEVNISPSGPGKPLVFLNNWLVFTLKRKRIWLLRGANPLWPPSKDVRHLFPALAHPDHIILFSALPLPFASAPLYSMDLFLKRDRWETL